MIKSIILFYPSAMITAIVIHDAPHPVIVITPLSTTVLHIFATPYSIADHRDFRCYSGGQREREGGGICCALPHGLGGAASVCRL